MACLRQEMQQVPSHEQKTQLSHARNSTIKMRSQSRPRSKSKRHKYTAWKQEKMMTMTCHWTWEALSSYRRCESLGSKRQGHGIGPSHDHRSSCDEPRAYRRQLRRNRFLKEIARKAAKKLDFHVSFCQLPGVAVC
ncbi:hypothetical protein CAPTEDRAFT_193832 [Capitella teleta]|uniref:Uncharacterized protein n=1 Tax=Capitella teleta TaxID=283909 RepID=R7V6N6_CAPTE|nr:hypothetical protein CAPTEDRAFT_193832 [Capitella teleta]|eukprot:ELU11430.1 hypothetical protein CAPTEDRAFT_193832 [Capitella teleta]